MIGKILAPVKATAGTLARWTRWLFDWAFDRTPGEATDDPAQDDLDAASLQEAWKRQALDDFTAWLSTMPETPPDTAEISPDAVDLYTILTEFAALRQEIRMQSREQKRACETLSQFIDAHEKSAEFFDRMTRNFHAFEADIRRDAEKRTVLPFLDMRDAMVRGLKAARSARSAKKLGPFRLGGTDDLKGIVEAYEMAIRRFDRALASVDVLPLHAKGKPFDPRTMRAVEKREAADIPSGHVVEERISGFVRGEQVIRTAEVVVGE